MIPTLNAGTLAGILAIPSHPTRPGIPFIVVQIAAGLLIIFLAGLLVLRRRKVVAGVIKREEEKFQVLLKSSPDATLRKQAEEELEKQAALLREQAQLVDLAPAAIIVRDLESRITFWNPEAEKIYGWTREEALGKITHELFQTQFPRPLSQIEAETLGGTRWEGELLHTKRNGERIVVASRWALRHDSQGNPAGYLEVNADITERKQAEARLRESEEI